MADYSFGREAQFEDNRNAPPRTWVEQALQPVDDFLAWRRKAYAKKDAAAEWAKMSPEQQQSFIDNGLADLSKFTTEPDIRMNYTGVFDRPEASQLFGFDSPMPIRDDSAGSYGTWNNDDLSWLDYLTAKASDGGNALANLGVNLAQGFSPIGTSEQGNMALQVPPIVSGIAQSYGRLAGTPSHPGNAYDLTGVPELDAPIQQDMSNVLLSLYGGNAVSGLARGRSSAGATAAVPRQVYNPLDRPMQAAMRFDDEIFTGPNHGIAQMKAEDKFGPALWDRWDQQTGFGDGVEGFVTADGRFLTRKEAAANLPGYFDPKSEYGDGLHSSTMRDLNGLLSDTGKPSIFGSALATAGEPKGALGAGVMKDAAPTAYRGARTVEDLSDHPGAVWASSSPEVANHFALMDVRPLETRPNVSPVQMDFKNPLVVNSDVPYDWKSVPFEGRDQWTTDVTIAARERGHDGVVFNNIMENTTGIPATSYAAIKRGTVKSPLTGETLFSDTGKPSILGSAMAGAGEKKPIDIRKADQGKNWGVYHALVGDDVAGYADYGVGPNAAVVRGVAVDPAFQRQGVASALHGRIQDDLGLPLTPDNTLSQAGYDFWKASYPEAVRDHKPNGAGYWIDDVNRDISKGVPEWRMSGGPNRPDGVLWSDNRPSLLGSALATAGENYDLPPWLQF